MWDLRILHWCFCQSAGYMIYCLILSWRIGDVMEKVMCHIVITLTDQGIWKIYTPQVTRALRETGSIYFSYLMCWSLFWLEVKFLCDSLNATIRKKDTRFYKLNILLSRQQNSRVSSPVLIHCTFGKMDLVSELVASEPGFNWLRKPWSFCLSYH